MNITNKVTLVTGAGGGIGRAVARAFAGRGARAVAVVDVDDGVAQTAAAVDDAAGVGKKIARSFCGDVCDAKFRGEVFARMEKEFDTVRVIVPAAGILRDAMAVKVNRDGAAELYDAELFRKVLEVNLLHPVYWTMQMLARIAEQSGAKKWRPTDGVQGASVLIGSVASRGNFGQIAYSCSKSALNAAAVTLNAEGMRHGVQTKIIHPGFVATKMVAQLPDGLFENKIKEKIPLRRLIEPDEIAAAVCALIENPAIAGPVYADGGLPPLA